VKRAPFVLAIVALLGGCMQSASMNLAHNAPIAVLSQDHLWTGPTRAEVSELDHANAAFSAAWAAGNVEALLDAYTEHAIVHPPAGGVLTTREQIRSVWAPIVGWQRVGHRLEPTLRRGIADGVVLEMGRWHSSRVVNGESPWLSGCYTVVWRRGEDQVWRMEYDSWTAPNDASWACSPR
jgi:ketosteroid isomerase-like protein